MKILIRKDNQSKWELDDDAGYPVVASPAPSPRAKKESAPHEAQPIASQATLTDFGLYKCEVCGKMVMGYDKESNEKEKHGGKGVEWKKVR